MRFYCVGHKPAAFQPSQDFISLSPVPIPGVDGVVIPDKHFGDTFDGHILSEYTQLFGLADLLADADQSEYIYIFQYRKFVSFRQSRLRAANGDWVFVSTPDGVAALFPSDAELAQLGQNMLLGAPFECENLALQYCQSHHPEDFARFMVSLYNHPEFDQQRCGRFASCPVLFPAPSLGSVRIDMFRAQMRVLREVWANFYENFYIPRKDFQRRVGGFLLERLHSFLIYEEINTGSEQDRVHGFQIVVSDSAYVKPTF